MNNIGKIGRNDPCPCGSGKKYKKCCGATLPTGLSKGQTANSIHFNREIAYLGKVGRRREEFCERLLDHKHRLREEINRLQKEQAAARGKTISCHKDCAFCCNELVSASLGECELIVFRLYQHEEIMNAFVEAFPLWLQQVQKHPDIFSRIEDARRKSFASRLSKDSMQLLGKELQSYWRLQIPCPFLIGQICSIYDVRPWACSSVFSVSPSEWCNPINRQDPEVYWTMLQPIDIQIPSYDIPFYDKEASITPPDCNMPDTVYRILIGGFRFFSDIPGLESIYQEMMQDEEIRSFVTQRPQRG
jgi:Fe-S-cluster containining protein